MATKDFIYDLIEGLQKNGDDYILLNPTVLESKDSVPVIDYHTRYQITEKPEKIIDVLIGACEMLHLEAEQIAKENGIDFDEHLEDLLGNNGFDDEYDDDDEQPF